jgi:hypothetical protein
MQIRRPIAPEKVATVLNDDRIRKVINEAGVEVNDFDRFARGVRFHAKLYVEEAREPTNAQVRSELRRVYYAAELALATGFSVNDRQNDTARVDGAFARVADLLERASPRAREILNLGVSPCPTPDMLRDPGQRERECRTLTGRCVVGCHPIGGRRRANGKQSRPTLELEFPVTVRSGQPGRDDESLFMWGLRVALLNAGGRAPESFNRSQGGPFIEMASEFLKLVGAPPNASAVDLFNSIFQAAKRAKKATKLDDIQQKILSRLNLGPATQTEISDLFNRNLRAPLLTKALRGLQIRKLIISLKEKSGGRRRKIWALASRSRDRRHLMRQRQNQTQRPTKKEIEILLSTTKIT